MIASFSVEYMRHISPSYKFSTQSLAVERKDEIFETVKTPKKPAKQLLLYTGLIALTGGGVTTIKKVVTTGNYVL